MSIPPDLAHRALPIRYEDPARLLRIFRVTPAHPATAIFYGRGARNRFDSPDRSFGVMYAAYDLSTCFAETITREANRLALSAGGIAVSDSAELQPRFVATLGGLRHLKLVDATDVGLYCMGAEAGEFNSIDYPATTQLWSREFFNRSEMVDGIYYRSRFLNGRPAVAIFERGGDNVKILAASTVPLRQHSAYPSTLRELNVSLLP